MTVAKTGANFQDIKNLTRQINPKQYEGNFVTTLCEPYSGEDQLPRRVQTAIL